MANQRYQLACQQYLGNKLAALLLVMGRTLIAKQRFRQHIGIEHKRPGPRGLGVKT